MNVKMLRNDWGFSRAKSEKGEEHGHNQALWSTLAGQTGRAEGWNTELDAG